MAFKERRYSRIIASGGGSLEAPANESFRVRDIMCVPSSNDTFLTLLIAGVLVGYHRVKGYAGNLLPYSVVKTTQLYEALTGGLFGLCRRLGCLLDLPIAAGETLSISRYAEAGDLTLVYDVYDAADVQSSEPNGSKAKVRTFLNYITNAAAITGSPLTLATSLLPTGWLTTWPIGTEVPSNLAIELFGILGCPSSRGNATVNKGYTATLKLMVDGACLFDPSQAGIPFMGQVSQTADVCLYSPAASLIGPLTAEIPEPPLLFDPPIAFNAGAVLTPVLTLTGAASGGLAAANVDVALLLRATQT